MQQYRHFKFAAALLSSAAVLLSATSAQAADEAAPAKTVEAKTTFEQTKPLRIALVNFKSCVEKSKLGQKEQAAFETLKKQMESILQEKEKSLSDVASRFNDIDYLDSLSPDAEAELKRQFRTHTQEFNGQQSQFYQTLSQTNLMIVQKLTEEVTKATTEVAKKNKIDLVLTEESVFYNISDIDVSDMVVVIMDENFAKVGADAKPVAPSLEKKK